MKWRENPKGNGVLVAADEKIEWLLPWWWSRYRRWNRHPVAFVDLGMSHYGKYFCKDRGELIEIDPPSFSDILPSRATEWEALFGPHVWTLRKSWFKKPFAFLATPFQHTLWLDLDCEVVAEIESLFEQAGQVCLAKEPSPSEWGDQLYNSGVVLYPHGSDLIHQWVEETCALGGEFVSDQHLLSLLIAKLQVAIYVLAPEYNWRMAQGVNLQAQIIHWVSSWGKEYIRRLGGITEEMDGIGWVE